MELSVNSVLGELLRRGDSVAVEGGRLVIQFASGELPTKPWLKQNRSKLLKDLARLTGEVVLEYSQYSTGRYGEKLKPGVTLSYCDVLTGQSYRMSFNAELTYARARGNAKKGQDLPRGCFRVKRRSALIAYWENLGFPLPRALSELHEHLNKLAGVLITADSKDGVALDKRSCRPIEISHAYLVECLNDSESFGNVSANSRQALGNMSVKCREESSVSIPLQTSVDTACTPILVRGQKSANKEQRNQERASNEGYKVSLHQDSVCKEFVYTRPPDQSVDDYVEATLRKI